MECVACVLQVLQLNVTQFMNGEVLQFNANQFMNDAKCNQGVVQVITSHNSTETEQTTDTNEKTKSITKRPIDFAAVSSRQRNEIPSEALQIRRYQSTDAPVNRSGSIH
jgi:hypothetical protein